MPTLPVDIVNRALDECGVDEIGDLTDGSPAARAAIRIYWPTIRQVLSAAHWNFARQQTRPILIGDAAGQWDTNTDVPKPWLYMYEWPDDCVHARFILREDNTGLDPTTLEPVGPNWIAWNSPAPFVVGNYMRPNPAESAWGDVEGHDPESTRVILANQLRPTFVYTALKQYPDAWDPLFEQAVVAVLAARLAMPTQKDKQFALQVRRDNIASAINALNAARVRDGDEGWTVVDHTPDWIRARTSGAYWYGSGVLYYPWVPLAGFEDAGGVY